MKKLMFATALVASAAAFAAPINATSFEGYTADTAVISNGGGDVGEQGAGDNYFCYEGDQDGSMVKAYDVGDNLTAPVARPLYFASASPNANYLELSTEGGTLWRSIDPIRSYTVDNTTTYSNGAPVAVAATGTYLDTLVQFTPTEDGGAPELGEKDKLAIWLNVDSNQQTNLMVKANLYDMGEAPSATPTTFTLAAAEGTKTIVAGEWYRLTIKAIPNVTLTDDNGVIPAFEIYVDGVQMRATTAQFTAAMVETFASMDALSEYMTAAIAANKIFPSLAEMGNQGDTPTLEGVGFKGSGALDDIVWTTEDPFDVPAVAFTLTWPAGITPVSYSIDGDTAESLTGATSQFSIPGGVVPGSSVAFTFTNGDGATKTMEVVASASVNDIDAEDAVYVWADYLGDAVNGAYTIDDANDLDMLRKGVAANLATLGETFKQTANIDMSQAGPFAGIGTYAANASAGLPFQGTYDGQGFKISDIDFTQRNYGGVFNQVKGGAIKNLTVENITCSTFASDVNSGEWGCAIVGNAGLGTTLQNLTAMGSFGTAAIPCRHNVAGIAIRLSGGASNVVDGVEVLETLVKDCTNNATLYGSYTKAAGITALTQDQNGVPNDYVLFDGCVNNANIAMVAGKGTEGRDGLGGIVGYLADDTKLQNCVNNGTLTSVLADAKIGQLVGWAYTEKATNVRHHTDLGGNSAPSDKKMVGSVSADAVVTGFKYATVANNVATTVLPPLTAGATYLLEGDVAASETPVATLTAVGDTIAFDAALGYTFAGTVAGASTLVVTDATSGSVTTYTAALAVAQIVGGAKYATLKDAVDAASAGATVEVLADCTVAEPITFSAGITVTNDYTVTLTAAYALRFANGTSTPVTFCGTGAYEQPSGGTGSPLLIGNNENKSTYNMTDTFTGSLVLESGDITILHTKNNVIKVENGPFVMNGGNIAGGKCGIKADSENGNATTAVTINGGTVSNTTAAVATVVAGTGSATVTINGGEITGPFTYGEGTTLTIPGTSTAKFDRDQSTYCESGYETVLSDGWYIVQAIQAAYPTYLTDADAAVKANYDAWKVTNGADANSEYEKQFLLNTAPATAVPATALAITAIEQNATAGWDITVECTIQGVDLTGTVGTAKAGNGYLAVSYTDDLGGTWTAENINITASANGKVTVNVNKANAKFMKVKLSSTAEPQN